MRTGSRRGATIGSVRAAHRLLYWVVSLLCSFVFSRIAAAQSVPELQVQQSASTVGVGDVFHVELSATSADTMPTDAQLGAAQGFVVRGQNAAPSQTHISINGARMDRYTLNVTWAVEAQHVGTFRIGPPSVVVSGARYTAQPVNISVVPAGQAPRQRAPHPSFPPGMQSPFRFSPFDPWKGFIQGLDNDDQSPAQLPTVTTDPKLALDSPRGPFFFLHATVDKAAAVVGEQVTLSVYRYVDTGAGRVEIDEGVHDPTVPDFVRHPLLREEQEAPLAGYASVGGRTWEVRLLRRWALFPLHAGDLTIGPMQLNVVHPQSAAGPLRAAETLVVHVTEPPLAGRPPGYTVGDVGHFSLTAQVSPREVDEGGAVGVHVELSGKGNVPSAIATPAREGVEWLTPEVHEQLGQDGHDAFGGKRTIDYVVRMRRAGPVDLGDLSLPYWDPVQRRYGVARASLGVVRVARSAGGSSASADPARDVLPDLPAVRDKLEGSRGPRAHADDTPVFWIAGIGAWPIAFAATMAGRAAGRRVVHAWRNRRASPAAELKQRLSAAMAACGSGDSRTADAAIARALEAATLAHAGVNVRGAVGDDVVHRLERAGVARDAASSVAHLLRECEVARFAPEMADIVSARERWLRAQGAIRGLETGRG
jgi:hypothetical protein